MRQVLASVGGLEQASLSRVSVKTYENFQNSKDEKLEIYLLCTRTFCNTSPTHSRIDGSGLKSGRLPRLSVSEKSPCPLLYSAHAEQLFAHVHLRLLPVAVRYGVAYVGVF